MNERELRAAAAAARDLGLTIELGTKGIAPEHLSRYLRVAEVFDARLVRSMLNGPGSAPTTAQAQTWLESSVRDFERAGVTLALETYEQIATSDLLALIAAVGSPALGVCLDPANVVARLETPRTTVELAASATVNVHVKDFAFARQDGWVGFTFTGTPWGPDCTTTRTCGPPCVPPRAGSTRSSSTGCPGRATPRPPSAPSGNGPAPPWTT